MPQKVQLQFQLQLFDMTLADANAARSTVTVQQYTQCNAMQCNANAKEKKRLWFHGETKTKKAETRPTDRSPKPLRDESRAKGEKRLRS